MVAAKLSAQPLEVFQRPQHPGDPLVVLGAGFEFIRQLIRRRAHLIGFQFIQQINLSIQCPGMWAKELIGRKEYEDWGIKPSRMDGGSSREIASLIYNLRALKH